MIEIIEGLPENVVGLVVKGRMTKADCSEVLVPAIENALEWHHRLRLYYEIRSRYPGAAWEDITLASEHGPIWERVAVVTDVALVRHALQAVRLMIPSEMRVFTTTQIPEGLAWITDRPAKRQWAAPAPRLRSGGARVVQPPVQYLHQGP
ncbi:MAG: STAS/SEC14 domain-containing protein [Stellaceae bacterium]